MLGGGYTWCDLLAVLLHIGPARLRQQHIVAVIISLHLLEVEDFLLAFLGRDLILVGLQAAEAHTTTVVVSTVGAFSGTQHSEVTLARLVQPEVQPAKRPHNG